MNQLLLICAVMALVGGCGGKKKASEPQAKTPETLKAGVNETTTPKTQPKEEAKNPQPPKAVPVNIANPIVEKAIRKQIYKRTGELTEADLDKATSLILSYNELTEVPKGLENLNQLTSLHLWNNQLTDIKGLEKLTQLKSLRLENNQLTDVKGLEKLTGLTELYLMDNPDLTKAQIDQLQKALPKCVIASDYD